MAEEPKESGVAFEEAIARTGGFGKFQRNLLIKLLPIGWTFVFGVSTMAFVMPAMICEFSISKYRQGFLYSAIYAGMVPCGAFWGITADMIGRRPTLIITTGIAGTFEFLTGFATSYWILFACKLLAGCAVAGVHLIFYVYLNEFVDARGKDDMIIRTGGAAAFGYVLQPLIAAFIIPLSFRLIIVDYYLVINSWKVFAFISSLMPILGFFISTFILTETPKYMLTQNRNEECLQILQNIYSQNTGNPPENYPIRSIALEEADLQSQDEKGSLITRLKPLFQYPYLIPALMAFLAQFITMGAYNTVRQHMPTLFGLALGLGQKPTNQTEGATFCVLFTTQALFEAEPKCSQEEISEKLDFRVFLCSAFVGSVIFISFVPAKIAVQKFGKEVIFVLAHLISATAIVFMPFSETVETVIIMTIYSLCMQNCITLSMALMIARVPITLRGFTVSLIMVVGRIGVILGNQVLPVVTNFSCYIGFWSIAVINLLAVPVIFIYSRQPNPYEEASLKSASKTA